MFKTVSKSSICGFSLPWSGSWFLTPVSTWGSAFPCVRASSTELCTWRASRGGWLPESWGEPKRGWPAPAPSAASADPPDQNQPVPQLDPDQKENQAVLRESSWTHRPVRGLTRPSSEVRRNLKNALWFLTVWSDLNLCVYQLRRTRTNQGDFCSSVVTNPKLCLTSHLNDKPINCPSGRSKLSWKAKRKKCLWVTFLITIM